MSSVSRGFQVMLTPLLHRRPFVHADGTRFAPCVAIWKITTARRNVGIVTTRFRVDRHTGTAACGGVRMVRVRSWPPSVLASVANRARGKLSEVCSWSGCDIAEHGEEERTRVSGPVEPLGGTQHRVGDSFDRVLTRRWRR